MLVVVVVSSVVAESAGTVLSADADEVVDATTEDDVVAPVAELVVVSDVEVDVGELVVATCRPPAPSRRATTITTTATIAPIATVTSNHRGNLTTR